VLRILFFIIPFSCSKPTEAKYNCLLHITISNSDYLKKLTIGNGMSYLYYCDQSLKKDSISTFINEPILQVIIINDDYEHYIPFYLDDKEFYVDVDALTKKVKFSNSIINEEKAYLNNKFDSLCWVYKTPKTYSDSIENLMKNSYFKKEFNDRLKIRDSIYEKEEKDFYFQKPITYTTLTYVYYTLFCNNTIQTKRYLLPLFNKIDTSFSKYKIYNDIQYLFNSKQPIIPSATDR
jgi:hypothetical protein